MKVFLLLFVGILLVACTSNNNNNSLKQSETISQTLDPGVCDSLENVILNLSDTSQVISDDYFSYFGFRDWYRWPLVYPYSLNSIDERDKGFVCDERNAKDIRNSQKGIDQIHMGEITKFAFNRKVLMAKTNDNGAFRYKMFRFSDKEITSYSSENEMIRESLQYGPMIMDSMITLEGYNSIFTN